MYILRTLLCATIALSFTGCTLPTVKKADDDARNTVDRAQPALQAAATPSDAATYGRVQVSDAVWVGGSSAKMRSGDRLPRKFDLDGVTMVSARQLSLTQIGDMISRATNIGVIYAPELLGGSSSVSASAPAAPAINLPPAPAAAASGANGVPPSFDVNAAINAVNSGGTAQTSGSVARAVGGTLKPNYKGPLSGFLDQVSSNFSVAWEYKEGQIRFYRLVTRTFAIAAMPTTVDLESSMKAGSDADTGGGSSSQSIQAGSQQQAVVRMALNLWKELETTVKGMIGSDGFFAVSQTTSSITVSAPYDVMDRVATYIDLQNEKFLRQVAISVEVLNVSLTSSDSYNLDLQGIFNNGHIGAGLGTLTPFSLTGSGSVTSTLAGTTGMSGVNVGVLDPNSVFNESNALIEALSKIGKVSVVTTASVTTMSGVPVPLQVSNTRNYVKSISTTLNQTASQTSVDTDKVNTGFSLNVLPKVMPDGQVMLEYGINISELVGADNGFDTFKVDTNSVQLPNVNQRSFIQQNMLKTGSTLVLAGFEQVRSQNAKSGVGSPDFPLLGGGQNGSDTRDILVIMITPVVINTDNTKISSSAN